MNAPPPLGLGVPAASAVLVSKYGASFPNCVLSREKNCLEAGCGGAQRVDGEIDEAPIRARFVLPCGAKVLAALPYLGHYGARYMRSSALKIFWSDTLLVPLWWIAFTVVTAVAVDALTDPIMGTITDQFRSRWGRRRPFIAVGSLVAAALFALLWMPCLFGLCPEDYSNRQCADGVFGTVDGAWIYFFIVYLLYYVSLDLVVVPLEAFSAELTPTYSDRNCLFGTQQALTVCGIAMGVLAPGLIGDTNSRLYYTAALGFSLVLVACSWALVCCLKERGMKAQAERHDKQKAMLSPKVSFRVDVEKANLKTRRQVQDNDAAESSTGQQESESANAPGLSMEETADASRTEQARVDAEAARLRAEREDLDALGIDAEDLDVVALDELQDNAGLVPGFISSMRNSCFRVLLLSEIAESMGDEMQYTVLAYMPLYVIKPVSLSSSNVYLLLAGTVLVFQLCSVPFWMFIAQRFGKYKGYIAYNFTLAIATILKIVVGPEEEVGLGLSVAVSVVWGIGLGGAFHLYRSILADIIDYDELISGQRREGQFSIFGDFIPKMVEVPSTVVPLLVMGAFGYQPGVEEQNAEVVWTLRLCFSVVPGFFILLGALALLMYPKAARRGAKTLDAVQNGIVLHAAGKEALDPVTGRMLAAPQVIRASVGGASGVADMEHFFMFEIRQAVTKKSKRVLAMHAAWQLALFAALAVGMVVACVFDWNSNVQPGLAASAAACTAYTYNYTDCAGFNSSACVVCAEGFYGANCSACPGLVDRPDDATSDFVGKPCNGQGTCDPVNGTCTCATGSGYYGPWCGLYEDEPAALFPIYIALLGIGVFFVAFHAVRLAKALELGRRADFTMPMMAEYARVAFGRSLTAQEKAEAAMQEQEKLKGNGKEKGQEQEQETQPQEPQATTGRGGAALAGASSSGDGSEGTAGGGAGAGGGTVIELSTSARRDP